MLLENCLHLHSINILDIQSMLLNRMFCSNTFKSREQSICSLGSRYRNHAMSTAHAQAGSQIYSLVMTIFMAFMMLPSTVDGASTYDSRNWMYVQIVEFTYFIYIV